MKNLVAFVFFLLPVLLFAQERQVLYGKAIADEVTADYLTVKNLTANTSVITDEQGSFSINCREGDVLEFSSEIFKTVTHTLVAKDFKEELFVIRVEPSAILLEGIELTGLTGNLMIDSKVTDVLLLNKRFKDEFDAKVINMGISNASGNMNFMAIFGMLGDALFPGSPSSPPPTEKYAVRTPIEHKAFSKILKESYPESFFTETVGVPRAKLGLFLQFCNDGAKRYLLDPKNEAELITYLKERYTRFANQSQNNEN